MVAASTDSLYHISFNDIHISYFDHDVVITDVHLLPDTMKAAQLRQQHRYAPNTFSTLIIPRIEITGIDWKHLINNHSFDCGQMAIEGMKWDMVTTSHPDDSLYPKDKKKKSYIQHIRAAHFILSKPDITYAYKGKHNSFKCFLKGGSASLENWGYNCDEHEDTSVFLYAKSGIVRLDTFTLLKPSGRYTVQKPILDFETGANYVTLKNVGIKHMINRDPNNGTEKEIYDLKFPEITLTGFNWNQLIINDALSATNIKAKKPDIAIRYLRAAETHESKIGSYPQQLLLEVALRTYFKQLDVSNGDLKYVEVTEKGQEGLIEFTGINGSFENITNIDSIIALHKDCVIKLKGKFKRKSDVAVTFNLGLADRTGKFSVTGSIKNLDGDEVLEQVRAFTIVEVTSFHLSQMDFHEQGDESYVKGDYTIKYDGLKISLFKFKSDQRKDKKGPLSFLGSTLVLYTSNPMPNEELRKVSVHFARDADKGFINMIWKNMYYAAKKTAVRSQNLLVATDGKETGKGEEPKKGFFQRLFGKKKKDE